VNQDHASSVNQDHASSLSNEPDRGADDERRFGGLRRLYGATDYTRVRALRVAVVGLGGVGSWSVEALARCGVASLTLIDYDHVAESNINRQIQATSNTVGQAKGEALRERVALIHPGCQVHCVDAFVEPGNWPGLLPAPVDVVIDACDQVRAKVALGLWSLASGVPLVCAGAAGGKRDAARMEMGDLVHVTHDPLLASMRHQLRRSLRGDAPVPVAASHAATARPGKTPKALGLRCVFSREPALSPQDALRSALEGASTATVDANLAPATGADNDGSLNCHGYGSSVMVTASFGMALAAEAVRLALATGAPPKDFSPSNTSVVVSTQKRPTS
jgi:tRNA threonylcarbamoyladenosine dehydratase